MKQHLIIQYKVDQNNFFFSPVSNLSQPGTFAGNDAIVAFARSQQVKVVIHQLNTPLWEVGIDLQAEAFK